MSFATHWSYKAPGGFGKGSVCMFHPTEIEGVIEVRPEIFEDERGSFSETYRRPDYCQGGIEAVFVQDNLVRSRACGTIRGLHLQEAPYGQAKLIQVVAGVILDVAVDLRTGSPTFGAHVAVELSARAGNQLFIPDGFAHGYCTLSDDCVVSYKVSEVYTPRAERAVAFDDPALAIDWPVDRSRAHLSAKDAEAPSLSQYLDRYEPEGAK